MPKISIKFKSNNAAEEFATNFSILGDKASIAVNESTAVVSSDDPKAIRFVKQSALEHVEEVRYKGMANRFLSVITECIKSSKETTVELMDSTTQQVTVRHAKAIASAYDRLSEENQTAFLVLATESKDTYAHAVNFAKANEENN
jgi:hypothetical protein